MRKIQTQSLSLTALGKKLWDFYVFIKQYKQKRLRQTKRTKPR